MLRVPVLLALSVGLAGWAPALLPAAEPEVRPDPDHPVASRLEGTWHPEPGLHRRLRAGEGPVATESALRVDAAPEALSRFPESVRSSLAERRVYLAGMWTQAGETGPFVLVEEHGAPGVLWFPGISGDGTGEGDEAPSGRALTVLIAAADDSEDDLLFVGETRGRGFTAWGRKRAAEAGDEPGGDSRRHHERGGGFSFVPPEGWSLRDLPGFKYRVAAGLPSKGFAPNVNVVDEAYPGPLEDYVRHNVETLRRLMAEYRELSRGDFETSSGLRGVEIVVDDRQGRQDLRQIFYLFGGAGDRKFVMTCTRRRDQPEALDDLFERCAKSFRIDSE